MPNFLSEDDIEQALLRKLKADYRFDVLNCFTARPEDLNDGSGRTDKRDVIFKDRVRKAALRLNVSSSQLSKLIKEHPPALQLLNRERQQRGDREFK